MQSVLGTITKAGDDLRMQSVLGNITKVEGDLVITSLHPTHSAAEFTHALRNSVGENTLHITPNENAKSGVYAETFSTTPLTI